MSGPARAHCPRCTRPMRACLCAWVTPTANDTRVLVLQHPMEVQQAKGSVRLLQLSLQHCQVEVGEAFAPEHLQDWLAPAEQDASAGQAVLLYPDAGPQRQRQGGEACEPASWLGTARPARLVVLDGTWRKSLKMLHLNPMLQALPRLALQPDTPSRYRIRKAHRPDQLSTLEATCQALGDIEQQPQRYAALLTAFEAFVQAQARFLSAGLPDES